MKKLLLILLAVATFISCEKETIETTPEPYYTIEGKWLWSPSENRADANTMYEFADGIRYTYYCNTFNCDSTYWNSLDPSDAIPGTNPYTFENDTLRVDLHFGNELVAPLIFECNGGKVYLDGPNPHHLYRLNSDCE